MARRVSIILSSTLLVFALLVGALWPQQISDSGLAQVKSDILQIRSENPPGGEIVRSLKKGEVVWIQLEIVGSGGKRCLISDETRKTTLGFVPCDDLEPLVRKSNIGGETVGKQEMPAPPGEGLGSLLQAIWKGDLLAVKELVEKGVDPNAQTKQGIRPLHMAAKKQETEITRLLIAKGADVNAGDQNGKTALMEAASAGRVANAGVLLSAGAKVNAMDENGFTALMWTAMLGFPELVGILLESGAEVNTRSKDGRTAMGISQKMVENTSKALAKAFKLNSEVSELQIRLANHSRIFQVLKEAGGRE